MEEQRLFQIGEVAKMFHVSAGSLRHYEQMGLLRPEVIDQETGYRYYGIRQFEVLNTIRYLRVLDMPLKQIADYLQNRDINRIEEKLLKQKEIVQRKRRELEAIERKIDHRLQCLRDAQNSELDKIQLLPLPSCRLVWIPDSLKPGSYLDLEYSIRRLEVHQKESFVFLGKVGVGISCENLLAGRFDLYDLVFLVLDDEDEYEGKVEEQPAGLCVAVRFRGSHKEAPENYQKLKEYMLSHQLQISGFSREITMIDYGITRDTDKFVTEIRIPVKTNRNGSNGEP